ncbi:MAG: transcriptional regulator [Thermoplasmata archaeon]|nr:MAG: transcriptional regulator [Thermoplasmata archaeon]
MKPPCEIIVYKILPHIRADIVRILTQEYNMRQIEISKRLGITQASVSQYLSSVRGKNDAFHEMFPEIVEYAKTIADKVASGDAKEEQLALLCEVCAHIRGEENFCSYHKGILQIDSCGVCFDEHLDGGR